jgi:hypothetical protein
MKYPWDENKEIDFSKSIGEIANQYQDRCHKTRLLLIDYYFISKLWKAGCIASWIISLNFAYCLWVTK